MQRTKLYAELVAVSIGWWLSGAVMAQAPKGSGTDQQFLRQAASDGLAEVQLGTMASTQAVSLEVQQFGRRMVTDHTKANQELMALAQAKHIGVSQDIDKPHQEAAEKLAKLQGPSFDHAYMKHMVQDHEKAVQLFTTAARESQDADVKAFVGKTLA
jgi:putative membrane protein